MKRFLLQAVLSLLSVVAAGCGGRRSAAPVREPAEGGKLVFATTLGSAPFSFRDETTGEITGIDIEIARCAAERLGLPLEIRPVPFGKLLALVKSGTVDFAAAAMTITPARARDVDFSDPYASDGSAFLYRAGDPRPTVSRGNALRIGTQGSSSSQFFLSDHGVDSISFGDYEEAVAEFARGALDTVFYDAESIRRTVRNSGAAYAITPLLTRECYGVAVRKDFPALRAVLNTVIRERKGASK